MAGGETTDEILITPATACHRTPLLRGHGRDPIEDQDQQAEAELAYFAKAEHSIFKTPKQFATTTTDTHSRPQR